MVHVFTSPSSEAASAAARLPTLPDKRLSLRCGVTGCTSTKAEIACFGCKTYLCRICDIKRHDRAESSSHYRRLTREMHCYVDFATGTRRNWTTADKLYSAFAGRETSYKNFQTTAKALPNTPFLGTRKRLHPDKPDDLSAGEYVWKTYGEVAQLVNFAAQGMAELGVKTKENIGIYLINREEWIIAEHACFCFNNCTVPLYDTLGFETVQYVLNQSAISLVFVSENKLSVLAQALEKCPTVKVVVVIKHHSFVKPDPKAAQWKIRSGVKVVAFDELIEIGKKAKQRAHIPPAPEDLCTICYTSGTTGDPKGVMITHGAFLANYGALVYRGVKLFSNDVYLSFLPLPHMFERITFLAIIEGGARAGFFRGDTTLLLEDIAVLRPTMFAAVPRLYNRIYGKIFNTIEASGAVKQYLFKTALSTKLEGLKRGQLTHSFWDSLVFNKLKMALGGRVRLMVSGAAPISANVLQFLRVAFSCPVFEGYGMTETCSGGTVTNMDDYNAQGNVGFLIPSIEIKLEDVPEMDYRNSDVLDGVPHPRGEVLFRGPGISNGYFKLPDKTAETIDKDGWLHSGDIGMWLPDQSLKIIDRKKNIFKLSQGEYIAPEKIENVCQRSSFVAQSFVYGNSLEPFLVAVIIPDEEYLANWAEKNGLGKIAFKELIAKSEVKSAINADILRVCQAAKLHGFEIPKALHLDSELFSMENGILTPTMKLKRNAAADKYKAQITAMYQQLGAKKAADLASKL
eukprot:TRINITY_DN3282_c0_g1_i1.p1 TRINITY_DN3282_c0_g1~~TRINITY_DN3282_c0_g1_i1.p1  ORF type:complete len:742 (-),score=225.71 TRINITY_DN3282_c0_g1_i1:1064-3289(-)